MTSDSLSDTFFALADPTRRAILTRLALGELSVGELARPFKISGPAITKHLRVLERVGLITRSRQAQSRPCRLQVKPLQQAADWIEEYRSFWEENFDRLDDYLADLQQKPKSVSKKEGKSRPSPPPLSITKNPQKPPKKHDENKHLPSL